MNNTKACEKKGASSVYPEGQAVPAPIESPVVLVLVNDTNSMHIICIYFFSGEHLCWWPIY